jgi:hypothetical protein
MQASAIWPTGMYGEIAFRWVFCFCSGQTVQGDKIPNPKSKRRLNRKKNRTVKAAGTDYPGQIIMKRLFSGEN